MVRKGSPVRVRQRTLKKRLHGRFFPVCVGPRRLGVGAFLGPFWGTLHALGKGSEAPRSARAQRSSATGHVDPFLNPEGARSKTVGRASGSSVRALPPLRPAASRAFSLDGIVG